MPLMFDLERVVRINEAGRWFTFRVDRDPPLSFWRIESGERVYRAPIRVSGTEEPEFFRSLVRLALAQDHL